MTNFRMMLLSTAAIGLTTVAAVSSTSAGEVEKKFAWSGHVNRTIVLGDDGEESFVIHEDGGMSGSRGRMKASAASADMTIGAVLEFAMQSEANGSQNALGTDGFNIRHSYVHVSNSMGKVDIGDTAHAGESFLGISMDGTGNAETISGTAFDGVKFNDSSTADGTQAAGVTVAVGHDSDMSAGRKSGISYSTPSIGGLKVKVSHVMDQSGSGEITYGGDFNGMAVKAGYMYTNIAGGTDDTKSGVGLGVKLPSGLSVAANYKQTELESDANTANNSDPEMYYGKVGYDMTGISDLGGTSVAISYRNVEDATITGDDFKMVSFLWSQSLKDYGTTVYGGYSNISYDTEASNFDDINGFFMGAKVVF